MATREELKIISARKDLEKATLWVEKNKELNIKKAEFLIKEGFATDFYTYYNPYIKERETIAGLSKTLAKLDDVTSKQLHTYLDTQMDSLREHQDSIARTKYDKLFSSVYHLWSNCSKDGDFTRKYASLNYDIKRLEQLENEFQDKQDKKSPEQLAREQQESKNKEFKANLKKNLENYSIPSLDAWLQEFRTRFLLWVEEAYEEKTIETYKYFALTRDVDLYVKKQKLEILSGAWEHVGKVTEISMGRIGADGSFNGVVKGEKGIVQIETILAGGYNIQRLHYRVLFKKLGSRTDFQEPLAKYMGNFIFELNQPYFGKSEYLSQYDPALVYKKSLSDIVQALSQNKMPKAYPNDDGTAVLCLTGYASLSKSDKQLIHKYLFKLIQTYPKLPIFVFNSSKTSLATVDYLKPYVKSFKNI